MNRYYEEDATMIQYIRESITPRFMGFSADTHPEVARAAFLVRYGIAPTVTMITFGAVLVGPVPEWEGCQAL